MFFPTKNKKSPTISKIGYWIFVHPYKISPYNYHLFKSPPGRNLCIWSSLLAYFFLRSSLRLLFVLPRSSGDLRLSSSIFCSSNRWSEKIVCYLVTLVGFTFQFLDRDSNLWSFRLLLLLFLHFLLYVWRKTAVRLEKKIISLYGSVDTQNVSRTLKRNVALSKMRRRVELVLGERERTGLNGNST